MKELVERKADPGRRDAQGHTAADYAREEGHGEVAEMLSSMGEGV